MDAVVLVMGTLIFLGLHLCLTETDFVDFMQWFSTIMKQQVDPAKEARVQEEMMKVRKRNYKLFSRCLCQLDLVIGLFSFYEACTAPGLDTITWAGIFLVAYVQHLMVGKEMVDLSPQLMKIVAYKAHILVLLFIIATAWTGHHDHGLKFSLMQGFQMALRFCVSLCFFDPWVSIPFNFIYFVADMFIYLFVVDQENSSMPRMGFIFCSQVFILVEIIASSISINLALRSRTDASLENSDAESLVSGFRRVLRGVCDGEVLLDNRMEVAQESECLQHLIRTDEKLAGRSFKELLVEDERPRFADFIASSTRAFRMPEGEPTPPCCLRMSFGSGASATASGGVAGVAADIYHVPVPGLFGAQEPYHLIAFKEDPESRPQPDADEDSLPMELVNTWPKTGDVASLGSESTGRSESGEGRRICSELREMTLLVDTQSELQDVKEAHLRFERDAFQPGDVASALQSGMPSLRKLVKITEWEKVRVSTVKFAQHAMLDPELQPRVMKQLTLQLPGCRRVTAEEASLKRCQQAGLVWLHLTGLHPQKLLKRSERSPGDGLQEGLTRRRGR
ncbi:unnamed protein product [Durusdinium trenchii]|uniref:Uncharacterized protein n=3 Tax=Durusdinium trenchii TaxID=1381693 RepID=A0ABP0HZH4_9DINO